MILLICGLSGSGKSFLLQQADVESLGFSTVKASDLLREVSLPTKELTAEDAINNQVSLLEKLTNITQRVEKIVLDGHLLIETVDGPQLVPDTFIDALPFAGILLVSADPALILARRPRRSGATVEEVTDLAELEIIHARRLARRKKIPFGILENDIGVPLEGAMHEFIKKAGADFR